MSKLYQPIQKELKEAIIDMVERGLSYREINRIAGVSIGAISGIIKHHIEENVETQPNNTEQDLLKVLGKSSHINSPAPRDSHSIHDCCNFSSITNIELIGLILERFSVSNISALAQALGVSRPYISKIKSYKKQKDFLKQYNGTISQPNTKSNKR